MKTELLSSKGVMAYDPRKNIEIFTDAAKKGGMATPCVRRMRKGT